MRTTAPYHNVIVPGKTSRFFRAGALLTAVMVALCPVTYAEPYQDPLSDQLMVTTAVAFAEPLPASVSGPLVIAPVIPPLTMLCPPADIVINAGELISFNILKEEYAAYASSCSASGLPEGATVTQGVFSWTPTIEQEGSYRISFTLNLPDGTCEQCAVGIDIVLSAPVEAANVSEDEQTVPTQSAVGSAVDVPCVTPSLPVNTQQPNRGTAITPDTSTDADTTDLTITRTSDSPLYSQPTSLFMGNTYSASRQTTNTNTNTNNNSSGTTSGGSTTTDTETDTDTDTGTIPPAAGGASTTITVPFLDDPGIANFQGTYRVSWSDEGAPLYELQQSLFEDFRTVNQVFMVTEPLKDLTAAEQPTSGAYYYRVRSWSALPAQGGQATAFSHTVVITVDYERALDVLSFPMQGVFTQVGGAPGNTFTWTFDNGAYSNPVAKVNYDITAQDFAGIYFKRPTAVNIADMKSLNLRIHGDTAAGYPVRMVIELKHNGVVQGIILVRNLTGAYQDISFPFYTKSEYIDEVVLLMEDDVYNQRKGVVYVDELFFSRQTYVPDVLPAVPQTSGPGVTDQELLDKVEADTARFFYYETIGAGHVKDTSTTPYSSIAATGFGLTALTILAERYGTSDYWQDITPAMAEERAVAILDDLLRIQALQATQEGVYGTAGFFYHFIDAEGKRYDHSEVSVVDTALLLVGALTAGEYFGGDVKTKADQLYAALNWKFFINATSYQYHMAWKPEAARGFTIPKGNGFLSNATYASSSDEVLLIALLALGKNINDPVVRKSYYSYPRLTTTYTGRTAAGTGVPYEVTNSYFGSLFTYLYAHCYFDFKSLGEDKTYFASDAPYPVSINWWDNSVAAIQANRQFCIDEQKNYPFSYHENSWGLSAVQRPDGFYEGRYGAAPADNGPGSDGVVALYAPLSSLPFFQESSSERPASNEGFQVMRFLYSNYYAQGYGPYGFYESYDNEGNFSEIYLGLDQGPIVLMIENYRSRFIWNLLAGNSDIATVLQLVFANGIEWLDVSVRAIADDVEASEVSFGKSAVGSGLIGAQHYVAIDYNFLDSASQLVLYTDNRHATVPYTGTGIAAGLVGVSDSTVAAPLQWVVFDESRGTVPYIFMGTTSEGMVQESSQVDFSYADMLAKRTLVDSTGLLGPYPVTGRTTMTSTLYLYLGCNFTGLPAQQYTTDTLTFEVVHE